jgi:branched-chain amino acid transport system ATP-binding protein
MFGYLRRLSRQQGLTILLVEQQAAIALAIADRGYVLQNGRVAVSGDAETLRADKRVRHIYLGGEAAT